MKENLGKQNKVLDNGKMVNNGEKGKEAEEKWDIERKRSCVYRKSYDVQQRVKGTNAKKRQALQMQVLQIQPK